MSSTQVIWESYSDVKNMGFGSDKPEHSSARLCPDLGRSSSLTSPAHSASVRVVVLL